VAAWFADNGVPADESILRRAGIRLENQANEGHAAMAGQGFALLTPLLWKGDVAPAGFACRSPIVFRSAVGLIGWSIRRSGGWCRK